MLILTIAVSLFASACENGDETSTTTTSTTITFSTTTTAASEPIDLDVDYPIPDDTVCFYLANFVAIPAEDAADAQGALNDGGINATLVGADAVLAATTPEEEIPDDLDGNVIELLNSTVGFLEVPDDDPLQVSLALRDILGIEASPINVVGFTSHIRFQPGTDPTPVPGFELPEPPNTPLDGQYVAVVDSGIVLPDPVSPNPNWFYGAEDVNHPFVIYDDVVDQEGISADIPASHGTFITGLIRQIAPSKQVTFAAARLVNTSDEVVTVQGEDLPEGLPPTAEIQVAEAMARLMVRHGPEVDNVEAMKALNLSLGTYVCDPTGDADMVTLKTMSNDWLETFPSSHIMAAAGNENHRLPAAVAPAEDYVPFWPAAFSSSDSRIHAVAAVDRTENEIVWVDKSPVYVDTTQGRPWVTDWAPGADLVNLAGGVTSRGIPALVCWSGSSFATAVASAQFALDITPSTPDYDSVERLTFVEPLGATASEVVTVGGSSTAAQKCDHDTTVP